MDSTSNSITIKHHNNDVEFKKFTGTVLSEKQWTESHVHSSSGSVDYSTGRVTVAPSLHTSNIKHHSIWIKRDDNGKEFEIKLGNTDIGIREGHHVSILYRVDGEYLKKVLFVNDTTDRVVNFESLDEVSKLISKLEAPSAFWNFIKYGFYSFILMMILGQVIEIVFKSNPPAAVVITLLIITITNFLFWMIQGSKKIGSLIQEIKNFTTEVNKTICEFGFNLKATKDE